MGKLFIKGQCFDPKRTAHRRCGNFLWKGVFSENPKFVIGCSYMLMTLDVCVLQSFHVVLCLFKFVFVFCLWLGDEFFLSVCRWLCLSVNGQTVDVFVWIYVSVVVCCSMPFGCVFGCDDACKCMQMSKLVIHINV